MANDIKIVLSADGKGVLVVTEGITKSFTKLGEAADKSAAVATSSFGATRKGLISISEQLDHVKTSMQGLAGVAVGIFSVNEAARMYGEMTGLAMAMERYSNTLKFASGSAEGFAANNEFLQSTVRALGMDLQSASQQFASLSAAAKGTALEGAGARSVFDAIGKASTVMGLSADQTSGALMAISQMISKGTVSAEELRGQLGERLPGAFQTAARAMGVTTQELGKMLESGAIATDVFLPRFAAQMRTEMAGSVEKAADSVQANLNRVKTDWTDLVTTVNNSAFTNESLKGIDQFLQTLSGTLVKSSADVKGWGDTVADTLAFVGDAASSAMGVINAVGNAYGATAALGMLQLQKSRDLHALINAPDREAKTKAINDSYAAASKAIKEGVAQVGQELITGSSRLRDELARRRAAIATAANDPELKKLIRQQADVVAASDRALLGGNAPTGGPKKATALTSAKASDADRYLESLQKQLMKEQELSAVQKLGTEINLGLLGKMTVAKQNQLVQAALAVDTERAQAEAEKDHATARSKATTDETQARAAELKEVIKLGQAYRKSELTAKAYLATTRLQAQRTLDGMGQGSARRADAQGLNAIEDKLSAEKSKLLGDKEKNNWSDSAYQDRLALAQQTYAAEVTIYQQSRTNMQGVHMNWQLGAKEGLNQYLADSQDVYTRTAQAASRAFASMDDALVSFVKTGKLDFSSLADSMISDLARIAIQQNITQPLARALLPSAGGTGGGGLLASVASLFGFAQGDVFARPSPSLSAYSGGVYTSPQVFQFAKGGVFAEAGPEAIMPLRRGADGKLGVAASGTSAAAPVINITINATVGDVASKADVVAGMRATASQLTAQLARSKTYGGAA